MSTSQSGAEKFLSQYGDRLVWVRYRQDAQRQRRFKTVALIVGEWPWTPPLPRRKKERLGLVKVAFSEREIRQQIKAVGGLRNSDKQDWVLRYDRAIALGLETRIVDLESSYS